MNTIIRALLTLPLLMTLLGPGAGMSVPRPANQDRDARALLSLIRANSFLEADRLAADLLADPSIKPQTMAYCGLAVLKAGRIREAEAVFDKVLSLEPDNPEAHLGLGRIGRIRNDPDAALSHLRLAVASAEFYEEALRHLWRTAWELGDVSELREINRTALERFGLEAQPPPSWLTNAWGQIQGLSGKRLFEMEGRFERLAVPLVRHEDPRVRIRMIALKLNGTREYPFDLDSASADFLTISPLLAKELGLSLSGGSTASGVGTATAAVRFSRLDLVELGGIAFRNVPVMVSDLHPFRGLKKGLIGTALLKRFNVTIDVEAAVMDFYPLERPELLAARIDRSAMAADVPLYLFDATTVEASLGGSPPALYFLDSAAGTHLVDGPFFLKHLRPNLDPARIVQGSIQGAQGAQTVSIIRGLTVNLESLAFPDQTVCEFSMAELNNLGARYLAGLLGNPVLWPYRVHLNFRAGRLILEQYRKS